MYDGILFDVDGVLLRQPPDHPIEYREAVRATFESFGVDHDPDDIEPFYGESKSLDGMRRVCERHGLDLSEVWPERERQASALQRRLCREGVRSLYEDAAVIHDVGETHEIGLVSNNQIETIEWVVEHFGLADVVDAIEARTPSVEGFRRGKPEPYYVEQALDDLDATTPLMVGDRASDVVAADAAGIDSVFVWREQGEVTFGVEPTYEIDGLDDLPALVSGADTPTIDSPDPEGFHESSG